MRNFSLCSCSSDGVVTVLCSDLTLESAYRGMVRFASILPSGTVLYILRDDVVRIFEYKLPEVSKK